jgi:hypothetical protein
VWDWPFTRRVYVLMAVRGNGCGRAGGSFL